MRYCFSCGGAAPTSKRHLFFARIPLEESHRLSKLCEGIASFEDAINRLGPPNFDMTGGMMVPAKEGVDEEKMIVLRTIIYRQLSDTADLYFTQHRNDNGVSLMLVGKSLEQARSAD